MFAAPHSGTTLNLALGIQRMAADVEKTGKSDIEAAAGMVAVRLNGLFYKWPQWGHTVTSVADCMAGTESFYMKSGAHKDAKKCNEDSMTVPPLYLLPQRPIHSSTACSSPCEFVPMAHGLGVFVPEGTHCPHVVASRIRATAPRTHGELHLECNAVQRP